MGKGCCLISNPLSHTCSVEIDVVYIELMVTDLLVLLIKRPILTFMLSHPQLPNRIQKYFNGRLNPNNYNFASITVRAEQLWWTNNTAWSLVLNLKQLPQQIPWTVMMQALISLRTMLHDICCSSFLFFLSYNMCCPTLLERLRVNLVLQYSDLGNG